MDNRKLYTVKEFCEIAGLAHSSAYRLFRSGEVPRIYLGRAVRIPAKAVDEWIERKLAEGQP